MSPPEMGEQSPPPDAEPTAMDPAPEVEPEPIPDPPRQVTEEEALALCIETFTKFCTLADECECCGNGGECWMLMDVNCPKAYSIRDADALQNECFPWFDTLSCEDLRDPWFQLDSSCRMQILVR